MNIKRIIAILLCVSSLFLLAGCGKSKPAKEVEKLINSIGEVTRESEAAIKEAEDYYDTLTTDQKNEVENYKTLVDARKAYNNLFYFEECTDLRRPDGALYNCEEINKTDKGDTVTYTFSLGDIQIESIALKKAEEYFDQLKKDGIKISNSPYDGYYFAEKNGTFLCTIGLNAIEDVGYGMVIVLDK